jgi:hypothetical protein
MVSPPPHASSFVQSPNPVAAGATATLLKDAICRLPATALRSPPMELEPAVIAALDQLIDIVMTLRSPTGGWPAHLEQTPEHLAPYVGEETAELLEALDQMETAAPPPALPDRLVTIPTLVPHLLWLLASSSYEVMRLVEGVRARLYHSETEFAVKVLRLVPVLTLTTADQKVWHLDLVTQGPPMPHHYLTTSTPIQMVDNDLDDQAYDSGALCDRLMQLIGETRPELSDLLGDGLVVEALCPFQPWCRGTLRLTLQLADMGSRRSPPGASASPGVTATGQAMATVAPPDPEPESRFTLDDFASTLPDDLTTRPQLPATGVFGDWLTFTDESWVQGFLFSHAQGQIMRGLVGRLQWQPLAVAERELACIQLAYEATGLVQGPSSLGKHTFVHEPLLVADVWPRFQWYLAQSSERVMQLMGGVAVRAMAPGQGWRTGTLYLRPLLSLATDALTWVIDLSTGRLLPTAPLPLDDTTVIDAADVCDWPSPVELQTIADLITQDFQQQAPAIAALQSGTSINLHQLEAAAGSQNGTLAIDWVFTLHHSA